MVDLCIRYSSPFTSTKLSKKNWRKIIIKIIEKKREKKNVKIKKL